MITLSSPQKLKCSEIAMAYHFKRRRRYLQRSAWARLDADSEIFAPPANGLFAPTGDVNSGFQVDDFISAHENRGKSEALALVQIALTE